MKSAISATFRLNAEYQVRPLLETEVSEEYVGWLNNPKTIFYLTTIPSRAVTLASQKEYVRKINNSSSAIIFGLFDNGRIIGSSGIQKLNVSEVGPWLGVLIGPEECRGMGLGTALVWVVTNILLSHFDTNRVFAGMRMSNIGSYRVFLKVGYRKDDLMTEKYKTRQGCSEKGEGVVVSCTFDTLTAAEDIGITNVTMSGVER